jgi:4-alpha-glucanotransferase
MMKITFNINYLTTWGQTLFIVGSIPELGNCDTRLAREMRYTEAGNWTLELELPNKVTTLEYRYFLRSNGQDFFEEWEKNHQLKGLKATQQYRIYDSWQNRPQDFAFYSSAFTKSIFAHSKEKTPKIVSSKRQIVLKIFAPYITKEQCLFLSGNREELGNWDIRRALIPNSDNFPEWEFNLPLSDFHYPIEYKFVIVNKKDKSVVRWETGNNRVFNLPLPNDKETVVLSGLQFRDENHNWRCAGLVIPVFSLRSEKSFGIGDFGDLYQIVDWVKKTDQKIIQILPINDTTMTHTWMDSYPYNAISIYALHPLYLDMNEMGKLKDDRRNDYYQKKQKELNALKTVDYEQVDRFKWDFFRELYEQEAKEIAKSPEYIRFYEDNKDWLTPYSAYSYLRDKNGTSDFHLWKTNSVYDKPSIETLCHPDAAHYKEIGIYYFIQFHLHKQLTKVRDYCYKNGIVLKGDIPIGISNVSIEAWTEPNYFNIHSQAGAPPDDFSVTGQNWGFPTYNWEAMEADQFGWWKKRFQKMSDYFDAYRIDHILGFFRIWEIPNQSVEGLLGHFNPSLPFSADEIRNAGFKFDNGLFTSASIREDHLPELFGEYASEAQQIYLDRITANRFAPKSPFDTQRKILTAFEGKNDEKSQKLKAGLFAICNEVLFLEDKEKPNHFHPRISAAIYSFIYPDLDYSDKQAFDYLYANYYYHRHNEFWKEQAWKHLIPLVNSTDMLVCGEDLGMIPESVPEVMRQLQILSLEIERMPKSPEVEFVPLRDNPYLSVCTTSTHDMSTIRGWWEENREKTQRYYNWILQQDGSAPEDCTPELCKHIVFNHLASGSMLCIIPFQDWVSMDENLRLPDAGAERINVPANSRHYWRYRMHLRIEDLLKADELNSNIRGLIAASYRRH